MEKPLRLLAVEDSEDDLDLLLRDLRRNGFKVSHQRVETRETMNAALDQPWDAIISDYSMPNFSAPEALELMKTRGLDLPFIILSGAIGEERAVAALRAGAHDFIQKGALSRLGPALERELPAAAERRARRKAEAEVLDLYDNAPSGYHSLDASGVIVRMNKTELTWLGYSREELVNQKRFADLLTPASRKTFEENFELLKRRGSVHDLELNMLRKDESILPVVLSASAIYEGAGKFLMTRSVVFDNTERKRLQEKLRQSQKLDAIGKFAGGVANDFNEMLNAILKHSQAGHDALKPGDPMRQTLSVIQENGKKAAALVRLLLAFSTRQTLDAKAVELYYVVSNMENMLRRLVRENIHLETKLDSSGTRVQLDRERIEQIIMILVDNAMDAMPVGGTLRIETALVRLDDEFCRTHTSLAPGNFALLSVEDTGYGIDEDIRAYIFEPFFTTKGQGKGSGLGLSAVYGIVKQSGGCIDVDSEVGRGTTMKIYLPRVDQPAAPSVGS